MPGKPGRKGGVSTKGENKGCVEVKGQTNGRHRALRDTGNRIGWTGQRSVEMYTPHNRVHHQRPPVVGENPLNNKHYIMRGRLSEYERYLVNGAERTRRRGRRNVASGS